MKRPRLDLPRISVAFMAVSLAVAVVLFVLVSLFGQAYCYSHFNQNPVALKDGWRVTLEGEAPVEGLAMPLPLPGMHAFTLERTLEPELGNGFGRAPAILVQAKYMNLDVLLDGVVLERYRIPENGFSRTSGTIYRMISLPEGWEGKTLAISGEIVLKDSIQYTIAAPLFAPPGNMLYSVILQELGGLIGNAAILSVGVMMLVLGLLCGKALGIRSRLFCTGSFAILFVCYDACLTTTFHLLTGNAYSLYMLEFFALMTVCFPLLLLARECAGERGSHVIYIALLAVSVNFLVQVVLHFTGVYELRQMLLLDHLAILLSVAAIVSAMLGRSKTKVQRQFVYSMIPLVVGGLIDMVRFYFNWNEPLNMAFRMGTMVFILVQLYFVARSYLEIYRVSVESTHYQKLAYLDGLTGIQNRAAFERDVAQLEASWNAMQPMWIVMCDVNGLKALNDKEGHSAGDLLLKKAAGVLTEAIADGSTVYRIGGDEFAVLLPNTEERAVAALVKRVQAASLASREPPELDLAMGYAGCTAEDGCCLAHVLSRADALMYREKQSGGKHRTAAHLAGVCE